MAYLPVVRRRPGQYTRNMIVGRQLTRRPVMVRNGRRLMTSAMRIARGNAYSRRNTMRTRIAKKRLYRRKLLSGKSQNRGRKRAWA